MTSSEIIATTLDGAGITHADLTGPSRKTNLVAARRTIARRLHAERGVSLRRIAMILNRHHKTVLELIQNEGRA